MNDTILTILVLLLGLSVAPTAWAQGTPTTTATQSAEKVEKYVYKKTPQGELAMYVHLPPDWKAEDKRAVIVFFFGGGWTQGTVEQFRPQATYLAGRGMVAARADYRVKGRHNVTPDKCVEDAKSAVRWLRGSAGKLGIDPNRIVASGGSAGGHIAACSFTTRGLEAEGEDQSVSSKPNLLVLFNPVLNCTALPDRFASAEMAKLISPTLNLTKDVPPAILFFGTQDRFLAMGKEFVGESRKLGTTVELYAADGQGHGFFNRPPWTERTTYLMDEFLSKHGYTKGKPTIELPQGNVELKKLAESPEKAGERENRK